MWGHHWLWVMKSLIPWKTAATSSLQDSMIRCLNRFITVSSTFWFPMSQTWTCYESPACDLPPHSPAVPPPLSGHRPVQPQIQTDLNLFQPEQTWAWRTDRKRKQLSPVCWAENLLQANRGHKNPEEGIHRYSYKRRQVSQKTWCFYWSSKGVSGKFSHTWLCARLWNIKLVRQVS